MNDPVHENESSEPPIPLGGSVRLWFITSVIGLFILAVFYTLKVAADLFLPIVLASFLGFLLTPVTRWLKKIGLRNFWSPLIGTLGFLAILLSLFAALCTSLAKFEPEFPKYVDHVQKLVPILQKMEKSSPAVRRLGDWLNPEHVPQVSIIGPSFVERMLTNAPNCLALLIVVHVLAFFFLLYGARLQKRLVEMIPGLPEKQNVVEIASEIEQTASRYFSSVTMINASVCSGCWSGSSSVL